MTSILDSMKIPLFLILLFAISYSQLLIWKRIVARFSIPISKIEHLPDEIGRRFSNYLFELGIRSSLNDIISGSLAFSVTLIMLSIVVVVQIGLFVLTFKFVEFSLGIIKFI